MKLDVLHQVVGKTRTGKIVVCASVPDHISLVTKYFGHLCYSADDLLDAHAIFEYLTIHALRKNDLFRDLYAKHSSEIFSSMTAKEYRDAKSRAGILTVFDLCNLGQILASFEFKEL